MAMRQYIGARYVPKFMGTYSATTTYEALSVVDDGYGTSYVSKKTTPAGTALTDTEYWTLYGATSGAILDLQNRVGTLENDVIAISTEISSLTPAATKGDLIILTDSYGNISNNFTTYLNGLGINDYFNHVYIRATSSSGGFITGVWPQDVLDIVVDDPDAVTKIIVVGGTNDAKMSYSTYSATLTTNIGTFKTNIKSRFTNVQEVYYLYVAHVNIPNYTGVSLLDTCSTSANEFYDDTLHMKFINGLGLYNPFTESAADMMHPNSAGSQKIAGAVMNIIKGEDIPFYQYKQSFTLSKGSAQLTIWKDSLTISLGWSGAFSTENLDFVLSGFALSFFARQQSDSTCKIVEIASNSGQITTLSGGGWTLTDGQFYFRGTIPLSCLGYNTGT